MNNFEKYKKQIFQYVDKEEISIILYLYGIESLLGLIVHYEKLEEYEMCAKIKSFIDKHNLHFKDNLPTR